MTRNEQTDDKPVIAVFATGGTIAGQAADAAKAAHYTSGVLDVDALVRAVPEIANHARVRSEQVANIGSEDMTEDVWFRLAERLDATGRDDDVQGMVVLHGTDTMEETGYFLNLVLKTGKPVVMTGAMRPANAVSADGPANLLAAVRLAACPDAAGRGVLVVFNDKILAARDVAKLDTLDLDAFGAPGLGPVGCLVDDRVYFYHRVSRRHTVDSEFSLAGVAELPRVEIIYGHAGQRPELVEALAGMGVAGVVHAGVGGGNVHAAVKHSLWRLAAQGVAVVCASRTGSGVVPYNPEEVRKNGFISADNLNPQKARVLLQLALTRTRDPEAIQAMFQAY